MSRRPLRRNDIVLHETASAWSIPARVIRRLDATSVEIINTLGRLAIVADDDLVLQTPNQVESYDCSSSPARRARPKTNRMPSLRRLKQAAAWYEPGVWKRAPRKPACPTPDYSDEITRKQLDAIQRLVDESRPAGQVLTAIGEPGW